MASRRPSLWMGNLDPYMDENFIKRAFATMGERVQDVRVISGRSPGYCFVVLPDRAAIDRCIARLNGAVIPGSDPPQKFKLERSMAYWTKDGTSSGTLDLGTFHIQHARRPPLLGSGPHVQNAPVVPAAPVVPDASDMQTSQYLHYYQHYLNYFSQWRYNQPYGYNNSSEYWTAGSSSTLPVSSATSAVPSMTHSTSEISTAEMRNAATARYAATVLNGASLRKTAAAENCASLECTATATSSTATSTALTSSSSTLGEASSVEVTLQVQGVTSHFVLCTK
ncbi:uncharacterized protein LOC122796674 isoform X2 [Protopterus annectens]|uniref:uncharacterized protein LOC122796674 isoform X2 n=1 Tax=Protopterus annectens TaxID=7888 RepID=UPI001CFB1C03|nr:uncharacterized protein LOC122796674 isoform X2 [Protopterus annectens]